MKIYYKKANFIETINTQYARWLRENVYKEFLLTVHNSHLFEKFQWDKLVRAEIMARKYVLGPRRKSLSNSEAAN